MTYDFDRIIDRRATDSYKWRRYAGQDIIPMWVADMDFAAPEVVIDALQRRVAHGVFGYADATADVTDAVLAMLERDFGWRAEAEWLVWCPGLEVALNVACRLPESPATAVATAVPIYPPFLQAPLNVRRGCREAPLADDGERWVLDEDALTTALASPTGVYLLSHPQNPTGRAWSQEELERLAALCLRADVLIVSDEIHAGLVLDPDRRHLPLATLAPEIAARTITLMSPSKTFNLAGLMCGFAIIPDPGLRRRFRRAARGIVTEINSLGYVACAAAYRHGGDWRQALLAYLRSNRGRVEAAVAGMPGLRMHHVEATYLAWIDCRDAGFEHPAAHFEAAGVGLSDGRHFGAPGYVRLNFGCPRATLQAGLERMRAALPA